MSSLLVPPVPRSATLAHWFFICFHQWGVVSLVAERVGTAFWKMADDGYWDLQWKALAKSFRFHIGNKLFRKFKVVGPDDFTTNRDFITDALKCFSIAPNTSQYEMWWVGAKGSTSKCKGLINKVLGSRRASALYGMRGKYFLSNCNCKRCCGAL